MVATNFYTTPNGLENSPSSVVGDVTILEMGCGQALQNECYKRYISSTSVVLSSKQLISRRRNTLFMLLALSVTTLSTFPLISNDAQFPQKLNDTFPSV